MNLFKALHNKMRNFKVKAILPVLILLLLPFVIKAQVTTVGDFTDRYIAYKILNEKEVQVYGSQVSPYYSEYDWDTRQTDYTLTIPQKVVNPFTNKEYSVVNIKEGAFKGIRVRYIVVKNTNITTIPNDAFNGSNPISIDLSGCPNLKTIGPYAFYGAESLQNCNTTSITIEGIKLPEGLTTIGDAAFKGCNNYFLQSFPLPSTVTTISDNAFKDCSGLKSIELPESLTKIGNYAFSGCTKLENVTLPSGLTIISENMFSDCTGLKTIALPTSLKTINAYAFCRSGLEEFSIPENVTTIAKFTFQGCSSLKKVRLESRTGVLNIQGAAFSGCTNLDKVVADDIDSWLLTYFNPYPGYELTGNYAPTTPLYYGAKLYLNGEEDDYVKDLVIEDKTSISITQGAFMYYQHLISLTLGHSHIGSYAFAYCPNLKSVRYSNPENFTFGDRVFYDLPNLEEFVFLNNNISSGNFGTYNFGLCNNLNLLHIPSLEWWFKLTFKDGNNNPLYNKKMDLTTDGSTPLRDIIVPQSINKLSDNCLTNSKLESLIIDHDLELGKNILSNTDHIKIFIKNNADVSAEKQAFQNIKNLQFIYIDSNSKSLLNSVTNESFVLANNQDASPKIFVPGELLENYRNSQGWSNYSDILYPLPVKLNEPVISSVSMENTEGKKELKTSESITLKVNIQSEDAIFKKIDWSFDESKFKIEPLTDDNSEVKFTVFDEAECGETPVTLSISQYYHSFDEDAGKFVQADPAVTMYEFTVAALMHGDSNDDNDIDIADIITVLNEIKAQNSPESSANKYFCFINSDIDRNGEINVLDQAAVTNMALGYEPFPEGTEDDTPEAPATRSSGDILFIDDFTTGENLIGFNLESSKDHLIFQGDIILPEGMELLGVEAGPKAANHKIDYCVNDDNIVRVIVYSLSNKAFTDAEGPLFSLRVNAPLACGNIETENVMLADTGIRRTLPEVFGGSYSASTGIESTVTTSDRAVGGTGEIIVFGKEGASAIYTLDGRMVASPSLNGQSVHVPSSPGIYVVRVNDSSFKVIVK